MNRRLAALVFVFAPAVIAGASCALGDEEPPGCRSDAECAEGFVCRGGACFRITTPLSPPHDPAAPPEKDAGEGADV